MGQKITYQMLYDKLKTLGFTEETFAYNGSNKRRFEHPDLAKSSMVLPDKPDEIAASMHITAVRSLLLTRGLIDETDLVRTSS